MDKKRSFKLSDFIIYLVCFLLFVSSIFTHLENPIRYVKYFIFIVIGFFLIFYPLKEIKLNKLLLENILLYSSIFIINFIVSLFNEQLSLRFFQEIILIILPIVSVLLISGFKNISLEKLINTLFLSYILSFIFYFYKELLNIPVLIGSFINALKMSEFPTESWMAFPFGLFLIYYLEKKDKIRIFLALIFFLLCFKRISFIAFILGYGAYWFIYKLIKIEYNKKRLIQYIIFLNFFLIVNMYLFVNGTYSYFIKKYTGITVNHFTQGRFRIYNDTLNHFSDQIILGNSLGVTNIYLSEKFKNIALLHSDLLKLIIEIGIILFVIWLISFMVVNLNDKKAIPIILYINILFISDNVFIYFDTLFLFYLILVRYGYTIPIDKR
ncbi:hypothetical protein [Empedobacter brevis]|uniref:hypothetical protein n=1 Tax=Empedobacter brevis TaxID=247 RepID=UPI003342DFFB